MRIIFFIFLNIFTLLSIQVSAGFINSKSDWDNLPVEAQAGYVMGTYDQLVTITNEDTNASSKRKNSFRECAIRSGINARTMIDAVNLEYQELNQRDRAPNLYRGICKVCGCYK